VPAENRDYESAWWRGLMSRRPRGRGRGGGRVPNYPWARIPGCAAWWDASLGLVRSGANVVTVADQAAGNADTLTGVSGLEPQWVATDGNGYPAFDFAGGRYFTCPDSAELSPTVTLSLCCWAKRNATGVDHALISQRTAGQARMLFGVESSNRLYLDDGNVNFVQSTIVSTDTNWHHCAVTYDGALAAASRVIFYFDGVALATGVFNASALPNTTSPLQLGMFNGTGWPLNGSLDSIGYWGRTLSAAEILAVRSYHPHA